jgi:ribonuclease HI
MKKALSASRHARLFGEPEGRSAASAHTAHIDGAARGNPGPASYGVVVRGPGGEVAAELKKYIGRATNNVAEYYALIAALDYAEAHGISALRVRSDSELLVKQMKGSYKVKSADLRPLFERARKMAQRIAHFAIEYVPREQNRRADQLANEALDATTPAAPSRDGAAAGPGALHREPQNPGRGARRVRARYSRGVFLPDEPLELPEGAEVEIEIRMPIKT